MFAQETKHPPIEAEMSPPCGPTRSCLRKAYHKSGARICAATSNAALQRTLSVYVQTETASSHTQTKEMKVWSGVIDAQAGMPSPEASAQCAFKNSMIHGSLQFTLRIAFRCVLHRCESQDIHCYELSCVFNHVPFFFSQKERTMISVQSTHKMCFFRCFVFDVSSSSSPREGREKVEKRLEYAEVDTMEVMIPPQVHLRRPCYDFSFL